MNIPNNVLRQKLKNVYFIWGRGKTTIANELNKKYKYYIYSTDNSRYEHLKIAVSENQPYMCRDFESEYGVKNFWELPKEVIFEREKHFVSEMTPMIIADLIALSAQHNIIICEGDIDYSAVAPIAVNAVHLQNCGTKFDFFNRPDHLDITEELKNRTDITEEAKSAIIENAYSIVGGNENVLPSWVNELGIKNIAWNNSTSIEQTTAEVEQYFNFKY